MSDAPHMPTVADVKELDFTSDAIEETAHLQRHFGRREILFFTICTIVGVDTIGAVAALGPEAFTWLAIFAVIFFIPSAFLFAELGTAFPEEGGPYLWVRLAFGRYVAAVNNFLYWITNPVWMGGTLATLAIATYEVFFNDGNLLSGIPHMLFGLVFIWIGTFAAILSFSVGKWIPISGAVARFVLLGFFSISVVFYAIQNGVKGVNGVGDFGVTYPGLIGLAALIMFNYVGFELPNTAGDEMKDPQKDVPSGIFKASIAAMLLYGVPILGILVVLPLDQVTNLGGFIDAIKSVFTVYGGDVAADGSATLSGAGTVLADFAGILFILCLLSSGTTWLMGSDRALAVSGYDGAAPRWLGRFSPRFGTPVRVNVLSGLLSSLTLWLAWYFSEGNSAKYFGAILGIAVSTTLISYLAVFPALWRLRVKFPNHPRPFKAPAPAFLSIWLTILIVFATIQLLMPGLGSDWFGDAFRPGEWAADENWRYFLFQGIPLLVFIIMGSIFYMAGGKTRGDRGKVALEEAEREGLEAG